MANMGDIVKFAIILDFSLNSVTQLTSYLLLKGWFQKKKLMEFSIKGPDPATHPP